MVRDLGFELQTVTFNYLIKEEYVSEYTVSPTDASLKDNLNYPVRAVGFEPTSKGFNIEVSPNITSNYGELALGLFRPLL